MNETLSQSLLALLSSSLGATLAIWIGVSHEQLCGLISFAAGTLLGIVVFHVIPEAWGLLNPFGIALALFSGYALFYLISRYVFHVCPACSASHFDEQTHVNFRSIAILMTIGLSIHSTLDGLALAIGGDLHNASQDSVFLGIVIHKFPEGLALCALLLKAGFSRLRALALATALELSTVAGWFIGQHWLAGKIQTEWIHAVMLHIAGGFVYLGLHAVLNEVRKHSPKIVVGFSILGLLMMLVTRGMH